MQLILDIENESVAEKIIWLLEHFKKDGLIIKKEQDNETGTCLLSKKNVNDYSAEYLRENWKELVITHEDPLVNDDDRLEQAHANWNKY
ncbi:MAG: hypothetical protein OQL19_20955 [Gammaproteobacteria bacterium]|nr:hypothetical protein [Gammaproteobacteria bacterium]